MVKPFLALCEQNALTNGARSADQASAELATPPTPAVSPGVSPSLHPNPSLVEKEARDAGKIRVDMF